MAERFLNATVNRDPVIAIPWLIVAGGFHSLGGMDKANAALADYLIERGTPVHLVANKVDERFLQRPGAKIYLVPRPAGSFLFGEWHLDQRGRTIARELTNSNTGTRVVVNGGNCNWADINWVHYINHSWSALDAGAPYWIRIKNRLDNHLARMRERRAINAARIVLANSNKTRNDLIDIFGLDARQVHTVYLGADDDNTVVTATERATARAWLKKEPSRPLIAFVGAMGHDQRKGFDILWQAWQQLCARADWQADLIVAGGGRAVPVWQKKIEQAGLTERVTLLGFTDRVKDLLAAADLLVSPVRYEAFGLNVQEAICRGIPAMVSGEAGVAERYLPELGEMILPDPENIDDLVARLFHWQSEIEAWQKRFQPLGNLLRNNSWQDMARRIVAICEQ